MYEEEYSLIDKKSLLQDNSMTCQSINFSFIDSSHHKIYLNKLLTDPEFDDLFDNSKRTQSIIYDSIIYDMITKKSFYKANTITYNDISQKIKKFYQDKNFSINFVNNLIFILSNNGQSADEILNEITFTYMAKKTLEFYSFKSLKDLIIRTTKLNEEQVPDKKLRSIYFHFKTLNDEIFLDKEYEIVRHLIDGPKQLRRPLDSDYGYYRYLPIQCKDYCQKSFSEFFNELNEEHKKFIDEIKSEHVNVYESFINELKNYFLKNCVFAHNMNEISYHPLKYLTKYCVHKNCQFKSCLYAHEDKDQLLHIFNKNQFEQIRKELNSTLVQKSCIINYQIEKNIVSNNSNNTNSKVISKENSSNSSMKYPFNFKLLKTSECKKKNLCSNIKNCPFYHSLLERRRNPQSYPIKNNNACDKVFIEGKWKNPMLCEKGDSCPFFHTRNEMMYDTRNFKKLYECYLEKNNGSCEYYNLCPYKHIIDVEINALYLPDNEKNRLGELLNQYDSYLNEGKKLKQKIEKNGLLCNNCKNYIQDRMIIYSCGHNCCSKCISVMKNCHLMCLSLDGSNMEVDRDYFVIDLGRNKEEKEKIWEFSCAEIDNDFYELDVSDDFEQNDGSWIEFKLD